MNGEVKPIRNMRACYLFACLHEDECRIYLSAPRDVHTNIPHVPARSNEMGARTWKAWEPPPLN